MSPADNGGVDASLTTQYQAMAGVVLGSQRLSASAARRVQFVQTRFPRDGTGNILENNEPMGKCASVAGGNRWYPAHA